MCGFGMEISFNGTRRLRFVFYDAKALEIENFNSV